MPADPTPDPAASSTPNLLRALGLGTAMAVVVGNVIGSGIFAKPGTIAANGGDFWLIITAWVFGGVLCLLGALCFAELATMLPKAGGLYVYLREAYGRPVAFLFGWNELFFNRPASIGALGTLFVVSLAAAFGWKDPNVWAQVPVIVTLILLIAWVNILGVVWGGRVQVLTTLIKAGGVALIAIAPFAMHLATGSGFDPANYHTKLTASGNETGKPAESGDQAPPQGRSLPMRFGIIMLAIMWAYNGWHGVTPVAEEIRQPQRNIPLALFGGIGILIVLYVSANVAYHGVLSMDEMAAGKDVATHAVAERLMGGWGKAMITAIIMCSTFGAINANLLLAPRVAFAMGRDRLFFRQLGQVHANYRTPATAIVVQAGMAVVLVVASGLVTDWVKTAALPDSHLLREIVIRLKDKSIFDLLTNFVIFAASLFYSLCVLAVFILRRKHPEWPRPYRTWGYPVVPALFLIFYAGFLTVVFIGEPFEALAGLALIALGIPVHLLWRRGAVPPDETTEYN